MIFLRILIILFCGFIGYLLGSIPNGILISKLFFHQDVREYGSKNSGGTNVGRVYGKKVGFLCIVLDMLKIILPFIIGIILFEYTPIIKEFMNPNFNELNAFGEGNTLNQLAYQIIPLCGMIGHGYSLFIKGNKGGKIVACYCSTMFIYSYWSLAVILQFSF